jgi:hypothetical protein
MADAASPRITLTLLDDSSSSGSSTRLQPKSQSTASSPLQHTSQPVKPFPLVGPHRKQNVSTDGRTLGASTCQCLHVMSCCSQCSTVQSCKAEQGQEPMRSAAVQIPAGQDSMPVPLSMLPSLHSTVTNSFSAVSHPSNKMPRKLRALPSRRNQTMHNSQPVEWCCV